MAALHAERLDVRPDRFRHPQPVEGQQRHQGVLSGGAEPGGDEEGADLIAVQADGVGLVVNPRAADMHRRRVGDQAFLLWVAVETGDRAQPAGDRRCRPALRLELTAEGLDVTAADLEQAEMASFAERHELAEVQRVGVTGEAPVAAEEPGECNVFRIDQSGVVDDDGSRSDGGHGIPPESVGLEGRGDRAPHG
jgi:hypothetical protein